jgi:hypothetical protein
MDSDRSDWLARLNHMTYEELRRKAEELIERRENGVRPAVPARDCEDGKGDLESRARRAWDAIQETVGPGPV